MIKKILSLVTALTILSVPVVWATPPTSVKLTYNSSSQSLRCEIEHVSSNVMKHHIRKIEVRKNQEEPQSYYFPKQDPEGLTVDLPLQVKPADVIMVKAICSEAGFSETTLLIPEATDGTVSVPETLIPVVEAPKPEPKKEKSSRY